MRRRGIGTRLHAAALDRLRSRGVTRAGLWVLDTNQRALGFYERHGWTDDGPFDYPAATPDGPIPVPCHRYAKLSPG